MQLKGALQMGHKRLHEGAVVFAKRRRTLWLEDGEGRGNRGCPRNRDGQKVVHILRQKPFVVILAAKQNRLGAQHRADVYASLLNQLRAVREPDVAIAVVVHIRLDERGIQIPNLRNASLLRLEVLMVDGSGRCAEDASETFQEHLPLGGVSSRGVNSVHELQYGFLGIRLQTSGHGSLLALVMINFPLGPSDS